MRKTCLIVGMLFILLVSCAWAEGDALQPPGFSREGGFYADAFQLEIVSPDGAEIWYTLDVSAPAASPTAILYTGPISIRNNNDDDNRCASVTGISLSENGSPRGTVEKGQVVRAVCRDKAGRVSAETVSTFFIGKDKSYYSTLPVISMVIEYDALFDDETGIYVIGNQYFRWKESDDFVLYDDPSNSANVTNYNASGREWERPCNIQLFENGRAVFQQDVGVRLSGNWTRAAAQKSFKFYARKEYGSGKMKYAFFGDRCTDVNGKMVDSFDQIVLRNGGNDNSGVHFRDDLNAELFGELGLNVPAKRACILFINGEFWGLYTLQERQDAHTLSKHFGIKESNITIIKNGTGEGDEAVLLSFADFYDTVMEMDLSVDANYDYVCSVIDVDDFINYFVAESYVNNWDFGPNLNNWMLWRANEPDDSNPYADGRWRFVVFDTEFSLGLYGSDTTQPTVDYYRAMDLSRESMGLPALFMKLIENPRFRERYQARFIEASGTVFAPEHVHPIIDRFVAEQKEAFRDTVARFSLWGDYDADVWTVGHFFDVRAGYALMHVDRLCHPDQYSSGGLLDRSSGWNTWTGDAKGSAYVTADGRLTMTTEKRGTADWQHQCWCTVPLEKGRTYTFSFKVYSSEKRKFTVCVQKDGGNYENYYSQTLTATPTEQTICVTFTMTKDCPAAKVGFFCGAYEASFVFSDISLTVD